MPAADYNATLLARTDVAPGLAIVRVATDTPLFQFRAGQYTVLGLRGDAPRLAGAVAEETPPAPDRLIRRAYSIASSSRAGEYLEFYVTLVPSGELTPRLFDLRPGGRLFAGSRATGVFTLDRVPPGSEVLLIATGTGLAPYVSMLRSDPACGDGRRVVVVHGARHSWDLGYRAELQALARARPDLDYLPVVSRPAEDPAWHGLTGHVQDVALSPSAAGRAGLALDPARLHVFLCGNPAMIEDARARLVERGFVQDRGRAPGNLHVEEYW